MDVRRFHYVCLAEELSVVVLTWQGVVVFFRVVDGTVGKGDTVRLMNTGKEYTLDEVGVLAPKQIAVPPHPPPFLPFPHIFPFRWPRPSSIVEGLRPWLWYIARL